MKGLGRLWDFKIHPVTWKFWRFLKKNKFFFYHLRVCWIVHNGFLLQNYPQAISSIDREVLAGHLPEVWGKSLSPGHGEKLRG